MQTPVAPNRTARQIKYLRLSLTDRCNMRCTYCVPYRESFKSADYILSLKDIASIVSAFAVNGVDKVRLTGGEPLVRPDIPEIVHLIAHTPGITTVGLTTNGLHLAEVIRDLVCAGLQSVNISLDSLKNDTFQRITGCNTLDKTLASIDAALLSGLQKVKTNTVVMRGVNDTELPAIAKMAKGLPLEVRFIELMPLGYTSREWHALHVPASEIRRILGPMETVPVLPGSSARLYTLPGWKGTVGIISPMSERFCDECNRVRITSSGKLKPCLRLPIEKDLLPMLYEKDFAEKVKAMMGLSCCKLQDADPPESAVDAVAMCAIGG